MHQWLEAAKTCTKLVRVFLDWLSASLYSTPPRNLSPSFYLVLFLSPSFFFLLLFFFSFFYFSLYRVPNEPTVRGRRERCLKYLATRKREKEEATRHPSLFTPHPSLPPSPLPSFPPSFLPRSKEHASIVGDTTRTFRRGSFVRHRSECQTF